METLIHADIFFFISSVAVTVVTIIIIAGAFYIIPTLKNIRDVSQTLKRTVHKTEEGIEDVYNHIDKSSILRFMFGRSKKK